MMIEDALNQADGENGESTESKNEEVTEKKPRKRRAKKQASEPEEQILPNLESTGMSEAWQAFYRAVAREVRK